MLHSVETDHFFQLLSQRFSTESHSNSCHLNPGTSFSGLRPMSAKLSLHAFTAASSSLLFLGENVSVTSTRKNGKYSGSTGSGCAWIPYSSPRSVCILVLSLSAHESLTLANRSGRAFEHADFFRCEVGPRATEGLVKLLSQVEHATHVSHPGHVPLREVTIKR